MDMNRISLYLKMFKANYKKYMLLFACNTFLISVCQLFANIAFNESFMDPGVVDPLISSNILLPTFMIFAFAVFFVPYTHISFNLQKEKDYGILETIGIGNKNVGCFVAIENALVAFVSLISGLLLGTIFSVLFYRVSIDIMDLNQLQIELTQLSGYKRTTSFFILIDTVTIVSAAVRVSRRTVKQLLSDERKVKVGTTNKAILMIGILILVINASYLAVMFNQNESNMLMPSFLASIVGVVLVVSNFFYVIDTIQKKHAKMYYKNMVFFAGLKYKFASNKKVFCFAICLIAIVIFFQVFAITCAKLNLRNVELYNPYDIAYTEYIGECYPSTDQIEAIAKEKNVKLLNNIELNIFVEQNYTILSVSEVNGLLKEQYEVQQNECVVFSQYDIHDGYPHYNKPNEKAIEINRKGIREKYFVKEIKNKVIINDLALPTEYIAVVSDSEFAFLEEHESALEHYKLRLIQCGDNKASIKMDAALKKVLQIRACEDVVAKYKAEDEAQQASKFLIFVITIMNLLLFLSNATMMHFKLLSGIRSERKKYDSMWKIGFSYFEIYSIIKRDLRVMIVLPTYIAVLLGGSYAYSLLRLAGMEEFTLGCILLVGGTVILLQNVLALGYIKYYINKIYW